MLDIEKLKLSSASLVELELGLSLATLALYSNSICLDRMVSTDGKLHETFSKNIHFIISLFVVMFPLGMVME